MGSVLADFSKEAKILEIGCGVSGLGSACIAAGHTDVTSVDFSTVAVAAMRNRYRDTIGLRCKDKSMP
jgi:predicted RNA methylase